MTKSTLYCALFSPPSRASIITSKLIGLDLNLKFVDFTKKEHLTEEFIKLNPQHTIPVLVDEGEAIWDSHAIMSYMVSKYAKNDSLYPKDLLTRARVDQRLHFESGLLFPILKDFVNRICYDGETELHPKTILAAQNMYGFLSKFLQNDYVVGNSMTIADVSINTSLITLHKLVPIDANKYSNIIEWLKRMKNLPENEAVNEAGAQHLVSRILTDLEKNKRKPNRQ